MDLNARTLAWVGKFVAPAVVTGFGTFKFLTVLTAFGLLWTYLLYEHISGLLNEKFLSVACTLYQAVLIIVSCTGCYQLCEWVTSSSSKASVELHEDRSQPPSLSAGVDQELNGNLRERRVDLLKYFDEGRLQELLQEYTRDEIHTKLNDSETATEMLRGEFYREVDYEGLVEFIRRTSTGDLKYRQFETDRVDVETDHSKNRKRVWELLLKYTETHGSTLTPARLLSASKAHDKRIYYDLLYEAFRRKLNQDPR